MNLLAGIRYSASIGVASAVIATGCFSSDDGTRPDADTRLSRTSVVMTNELTFDAACVRVRVGETVRWTNPSAVAHTVTADASKAANAANVRLPDGAEPFDSGSVPAGGQFDHTFTVSGRYDYVCLPHEGAGMVGTVIVEQS